MIQPIDIPVPKTAIVLFNNGAFGGAERRFSALFRHLSEALPGRFYYFVNRHMMSHIRRILPGYPEENIRIIDFENTGSAPAAEPAGSIPSKFNDNTEDPLIIDKRTWLPRKVFWFQKNKSRQRYLFKIIDSYRKSLGIEVFIGVFSGVLPLVFYFDSADSPAIIFSDMDSWFSDVLSDTKKLWYRKYYSFNNALGNADVVDFLSPYILEGVRKRNVTVPQERVSITPCSFADYSKCSVGTKELFSFAFSGRLEPDKNPLLYLEAAKNILSDYPKTHFYLLGEGSLVNEVREYIDSNNLGSQITFQFHNNPPEIFASTSVFVSLQSGTNYPSQSVIEAMACGNAVIASNTGDTHLLVDESVARMVALDVTSVTGAMKFFIENKGSALSLGAEARRRVIENHTIEKSAAYYVGLIKKAKQIRAEVKH